MCAITNYFFQRNNLTSPLAVAGQCTVVSAVALLILAALGFSRYHFLGLNTLGNIMLYAGAVTAGLCAIILFACHMKKSHPPVEDVLSLKPELDFYKEDWISFQTASNERKILIYGFPSELNQLVIGRITLEDAITCTKVSWAWHDFILSDPWIACMAARQTVGTMDRVFERAWGYRYEDYRACYRWTLYNALPENPLNPAFCSLNPSDTFVFIDAYCIGRNCLKILSSGQFKSDYFYYILACQALAYRYIESNGDWEYVIQKLMIARSSDDIIEIQIQDIDETIQKIRECAALSLARQGKFVAAVEQIDFCRSDVVFAIICQMVDYKQPLKRKKLEQLFHAEQLADKIEDAHYRNKAYCSIAIAHALLQEIDLSYQLILKIKFVSSYPRAFILAVRELATAEFMISNDCPLAKSLLKDNFSVYNDQIQSHVIYRQALTLVKEGKFIEALSCDKKIIDFRDLVDLYATLGIEALVARQKDVLKFVAERVPFLITVTEGYPFSILEVKLQQQLLDLIFIQAQCGLVAEVKYSLRLLKSQERTWYNGLSEILRCETTLGLFAQAFETVSLLDEKEVEDYLVRHNAFVIILEMARMQFNRSIKKSKD